MEPDVPEALRALIAAERVAPLEDLATRAGVRAKLAASVAPTGLALVGVKVIAGFALAIGVGAVATRARTEEPAARPAPMVTVPAPLPSRAPPPETIALRVDAPSTPLPPVAPPPTKRHAKSPPRAATVEPATPSQAKLLREAITAMAAGDARRAHALTVRDAQLHPHGVLGEERDALQIEALARLRRFGEASIARDEFLVRYPNSIHRARVRAIGAEEMSR